VGIIIVIVSRIKLNAISATARIMTIFGKSWQQKVLKGVMGKNFVSNGTKKQ
jgi:hypothetical protein